MSWKPPNFSWPGVTWKQAELLDFLDHLGKNGWARNGQSEALVPTLLADLEQAGLPFVQVKEATASIGYHGDTLHQLERWESKRTTGKFGR